CESVKFTFLQYAKQLGLQFKRDRPDFVQKHRPAIGQLEASDALGDSAREGALFMPEHLAFEKAGGDRSAVQLDERALAPSAQIVDGARDQFLPGSGLAIDQYGRIGRRHGLDLLQQTPQGGASADNLLEVQLAADFIFQVNFFLRQPVLQLGDLTIGERVLYCDGHLVAD